MSDIGGDRSDPTQAPVTPPTYADRLVRQERAAGQPGQHPHRPYRSARTRATLLVALLWVSFGSSLIACAMNVWGWSTIEAFLAGRATAEDLDTFDVVFGGYAFVEIAIFVATAVAWLAWQSRTIDNEAPLGIGPSPWSPGVSALWWFVPIANLIQPYRIHRDIWRRYVSATNSSLVLWWWLAWIASSIVSNAAGRVWLLVDTLEAIQAALLVWLVADILSAVSALVAIALVGRIQRRADAIAAMAADRAEDVAVESVTAT